MIVIMNITTILVAITIIDMLGAWGKQHSRRDRTVEAECWALGEGRPRSSFADTGVKVQQSHAPSMTKVTTDFKVLYRYVNIGVCMYVCMHICMYVCMHAYMYYVCMFLCRYECTQAYIYNVCVRACMFVYIYICTCMCKCTIHICAYIYINAILHFCTHTCFSIYCICISIQMYILMRKLMRHACA